MTRLLSSDVHTHGPWPAQKPRKIKLRGSDGRSYVFLCKPKDDLRKDCRVMEFYSMINKLLRRNQESRYRTLSATRPANNLPGCTYICVADGISSTFSVSFASIASLTEQLQPLTERKPTHLYLVKASVQLIPPQGDTRPTPPTKCMYQISSTTPPQAAAVVYPDVCCGGVERGMRHVGVGTQHRAAAHCLDRQVRTARLVCILMREDAISSFRF